MAQVSKIHSLQRPAIERMLRLHQELKADRYPNCSSLAKEMEVSTKTISRDVEFMRDRMLLPIEYDSTRHGYYYTESVESLPTIDISEGELLALSIAKKAMDHYKGTPFERPLNTALNKITASLPERLTANLAQLSDVISFKSGASAPVDQTLLQRFTSAALQRQEIAFQYKKIGSGKAELRQLQPYHLTHFLGKWYVIGFDLKRQAIRTFLLNRASAAELLDGRFELPPAFSAADYLSSSFGIYSPTGEHRARIRFLPPTSEYISENTWHPTQETKFLPGGVIEIQFSLGSLIEVASWILSWGPTAIALEPPALRAIVSERARAVAALYAESPSPESAS